MKYELFYATGGHGGPYEGKAAALEAARRLVGGANGSYIDVVPYSQPWEATPVRDLHLLRGVERVYAAAALGDWYSEKHETLADKQFAERDALPEGWSPNPEDGCHHIVACALTPEHREWAIEMMRSGNQAHAAIGAAALGGPCVKKRGAERGASFNEREFARTVDRIVAVIHRAQTATGQDREPVLSSRQIARRMGGSVAPELRRAVATGVVVASRHVGGWPGSNVYAIPSDVDESSFKVSAWKYSVLPISFANREKFIKELGRI